MIFLTIVYSIFILRLISSTTIKSDQDLLNNYLSNSSIIEYSDYVEKILSLRDKYARVGKYIILHI